MWLQNRNMVPSTYPPELCKEIFAEEQTSGSATPGILGEMIIEYRSRHGGKCPAKIFLNAQAYYQIVRSGDAFYQFFKAGDLRVLGVSARVFTGGDGPEIYLSDETEA